MLRGGLDVRSRAVEVGAANLVAAGVGAVARRGDDSGGEGEGFVERVKLREKVV